MGRRQTNVTNVTKHPLRQTIWWDTWQRTGKKADTTLTHPIFSLSLHWLLHCDKVTQEIQFFDDGFYDRSYHSEFMILHSKKTYWVIVQFNFHSTFEQFNYTILNTGDTGKDILAVHYSEDLFYRLQFGCNSSNHVSLSIICRYSLNFLWAKQIALSSDQPSPFMNNLKLPIFLNQINLEMEIRIPAIRVTSRNILLILSPSQDGRWNQLWSLKTLQQTNCWMPCQIRM